MPEIQDIAYWMALAHLPRWRTEKINSLIVELIHNRKLSLAEFLDLNADDWQNEFQFSEKEAADLLNAKSSLPELSLTAESLWAEDFEIIPINSSEYSKTLKANLKLRQSPSRME